MDANAAEGPVFIDTNVPIYAAGRPHPLREPARRVIRAIAQAQMDAFTDVEVLQELLYRYTRLGEREKGFQIFDAFTRLMAGRVLPVDVKDLQRSRTLLDRYATLSPRDAIHVAVMQRHRITRIITADRDFDAVPDLVRLDLSAF